MKKNIMILFACIGLGAAVYFFMQSQYMLHRKPVYIALVGPLGQSSGKAMRQGVELYRDQINQQGGIGGRKLEFIFRDDQNDPEQAERIALELAEENRALVVLGHYYSRTSLSAGRIYKKNRIPTITGSASAESVIRDNEWYFRTVPGNAFEAKFVADYIEKALQSKYASIIFSNDDYGKTLLAEFEKTVAHQGMKLAGKWETDINNPSDEQLKAIQDGLAATNNPGIIYFALHAAEGAKIITTLKDAGASYPIIGSYAFARSFLGELKPYAKEWETPGYYSDGMYFVAPFMLSLSGVKGFEFARKFRKKYGEKPGVVSACYYDAVQIAVQAMNKKDIHGTKYIREDRKRIRNALAGLYDEKNAVKGVTGLLWFDKAGGVRKEYAVGRWEKQKEVVASIQYDQHNGNVDEIMQGALNGEVLLTDGLVMTSTQIVHVEINQLKIIDIDWNKNEFIAAFKLQFSYPAHYDTFQVTPGIIEITSVIEPLEFTNALSPIVLGDPVEEEIKKRVITKVFQVQGRFRADINLDESFLFNKEKRLCIRFRHSLQSYDDLIYAPKTSDARIIQTFNGLYQGKYQCFSNILSKKSSLGVLKYLNSDHNLDYSMFNIMVVLQRGDDSRFGVGQFSRFSGP